MKKKLNLAFDRRPEFLRIEINVSKFEFLSNYVLKVLKHKKERKRGLHSSAFCIFRTIRRTRV